MFVDLGYSIWKYSPMMPSIWWFSEEIHSHTGSEWRVLRSCDCILRYKIVLTTGHVNSAEFARSTVILHRKRGLELRISYWKTELSALLKFNLLFHTCIFFSIVQPKNFSPPTLLPVPLTPLTTPPPPNIPVRNEDIWQHRVTCPVLSFWLSLIILVPIPSSSPLIPFFHLQSQPELFALTIAIKKQGDTKGIQPSKLHGLEES
jgi:hypothetical protein